MGIITDVLFLSLEFDFEEEGAIRSEVFLEIEKDGEKSRVQHKVQLQDVSFGDFLGEEKIAELSNPANNFSSYIQSLRKLITLKVASDLNLKVADGEYKEIKPTRLKVEVLEASQAEQDDLLMDIMMGRL